MALQYLSYVYPATALGSYITLCLSYLTHYLNEIPSPYPAPMTAVLTALYSQWLTLLSTVCIVAPLVPAVAITAAALHQRQHRKF